MAATLSQYGQTVQIQNNSGSAAAAAAPVGGVNLFAKGTAGSAKLYVNVEGSQDDLEVAADLKRWVASAATRAVVRCSVRIRRLLGGTRYPGVRDALGCTSR